MLKMNEPKDGHNMDENGAKDYEERLRVALDEVKVAGDNLEREASLFAQALRLGADNDAMRTLSQRLQIARRRCLAAGAALLRVREEVLTREQAEQLARDVLGVVVHEVCGERQG
jgi:hypothetical protein